MRKTKYFIRQYKFEFIAFFVNLIVTTSTLLLINISTALVVSILFLFASLIVVIYLKTKDKDFYFLSLDKTGQEKDWVGRGKFKFIRNEKCFEITESHVGYIFPKTSDWDDYSFQFDFKIINKTIAWIVRAIDLSNYVMLQCTMEGINPHIRINGQWIPKKHTDEDVNFTFDDKLSPDTWYKGRIICEKRSIRITIFSQGKNALFDRHWLIPDQMLIHLVEVIKEGNSEKELIKQFQQNMDFDFGAIGVRNHGTERALIKNILIEKL